MKIIFSFIILASLVGCETITDTITPAPNFSSNFTTEKIMKLHQGMNSNEILAMFGDPKSVDQAVCGAGVGKAWTCTTWEYGEWPYDSASFTFAGDSPGTLILNTFKVDRK